MKRIRPYFKYFRSARGAVLAAVFFGIIYGATSGFGVPTLATAVFPRIFKTENTEVAKPATPVDKAPKPAVAAWKNKFLNWVGFGPVKPQPVSESAVFWIAAAIPLAFAIRGLSGYLNSYFTQLAGLKILEAIRVEYFLKIQRLPLSFIHARPSGDLVSRGLADTAQLQQALTSIANDGVKQPMQLLFTLFFLAAAAVTEPGTGILLGTLGLIPLVVFPIRYVARKVFHRSAQVQAHLGEVTSQMSENISAAREVRAFGLEERETAEFARSSGHLITAQMKIVKYAQALSPSIEVISAIGIALTMVSAYRRGVHLETFIAIIMALYMAYEPIKKIGLVNNDIKRATASLDRLETVLNEPVTIADPASPVPVGRLKGTVVFEKVGFSYKPETAALVEVSTTIPAGTVAALVGPSGAGKSTFANLIPRFYDVGAGRVTIDGIDVRAMRQADLRRNIALVSQDPVLFNDSILNNLLLGRPDATRAEVEAAAKNAFAHDFIAAMPRGYDTVVGERGSQLSGGQKQRLAIARAFLRNAPILILDEATSALDSESEAAIQAALRTLVLGKTVVIIAHRFSTIRDASMILVFDQGRVVATGTHDELHAGNALYRGLYDRQAGAAGTAGNVQRSTLNV